MLFFEEVMKSKLYHGYSMIFITSLIQQSKILVISGAGGDTAGEVSVSGVV